MKRPLELVSAVCVQLNLGPIIGNRCDMVGCPVTRRSTYVVATLVFKTRRQGSRNSTVAPLT